VSLNFFIFTVLVLVSSVAIAADKQTQLKGDDLKMAMQMNDMFARHLYSTVCLEEEKYFSLQKELVGNTRQEAILSLKSSCDCVTNVMMEKVSANDMIGYVTAMYGVNPSGSVEANKLPNVSDKSKFNKIGQLTRDLKMRRKCGFSK